MITRRLSRTVVTLFAGSDAGHYPLPAELLEARTKLDAVTAAVEALAPVNGEPAAKAAAVRAALADPGATNLAKGILAARQTDVAAREHAAVLHEAADHAAGAVEAAADGEEIVVECLRPALDEVMGRVREQIRTFTPHGVSEAQLFAAPAKVRSAWLAFGESAQRYTAVSAARAALLDKIGRAPSDERGLFSLMRNTDDVWPECVATHRPLNQLVQPWDDDPTGRSFLLWAVQVGAAVWLPLPAEQEAQWQRVFGARVAEMTAARRGLGGYRELAFDVG